MIVYFPDDRSRKCIQMPISIGHHLFIIQLMTLCIPLAADDSRGRRTETSGLDSVNSHIKPWSQTWQETREKKRCHKYPKCSNHLNLNQDSRFFFFFPFWWHLGHWALIPVPLLLLHICVENRTVFSTWILCFVLGVFSV